MRYLVYISLFVLFASCEKELRYECKDRDELNNCQPFDGRTEQTFFDDLIGEYAIVFEIGSPESRTPSLEFCYEPDPDEPRLLVLRADSTYLSRWIGTEMAGTWWITTDTLPDGSFRRQITTDSGDFFGAPNVRCDDNFYFRDSRPMDGGYTLFRRIN